MIDGGSLAALAAAASVLASAAAVAVRVHPRHAMALRALEPGEAPRRAGRRPLPLGRAMAPPARRRAVHAGAACAVGLALGSLWPGALVVAPLFAVVGWRLPAIADARAERRRRALADAELPNFLDLLAAASAAGLGAQVAVRRAAAATTGPLAEELASTLAAVDLGARWRDELRALAARLRVPDLSRTVHAVARTETLGASLADALRDLAEAVRRDRAAAAAEAARKAPVKMLFPLVFMILPAFLLLTVVPVLISTLRSIR